MVLYITHENKCKLKKCLLALRKQVVISIEEVIVNIGYDPEKLDEYSSFIINEEIKKLILKSSSGKKSNNIIYINSDFTAESAREIIHFVYENTRIERVVFLTEKHKHEEYYELFEEVMFFPQLKKIHIIECEQIQNSMFNWINNLERT